jgi:O-acetyl-ADP-ribose deacetylase (regulator of RNase III)
MGAGVGGLDLAACAREMVGAVTEHFAAHPGFPLERVVFAVRDAEARSTFERSIEEA